MSTTATTSLSPAAQEEAKNKYNVDLQPLSGDDRLIVFGNDYICDHQPVTLAIKTKFSWSGDSMDVLDVQTGEPWFHVKGNVMSDSKTKVICGKDQKPLFVVATKQWWNLLNDDQMVMDVRGATTKEQVNAMKKDKANVLFQVSSSLGNMKQKTTVKNLAQNGKEVEITGKCSLLQQQCALWRDGDDTTKGSIPLAKFMSPIELQNFVGLKSTCDSTSDYYLTVTPGADIAMALAIILAIREMENTYNVF